jgi:hypothetical protein
MVHSTPRRLSSFVGALLGACALIATAGPALADFPKYDHVFLIIEENEDFGQVIGNKYAPILNALAAAYGLATDYRGVGDPSEPNYIAMLGGDVFGIADDDPYWFPGHSVDADNLMSQLGRAGKTWKGYLQELSYPGYRGYCYPDKCNGIPDSDTQYVAKHNGIVNFTKLQTPAEFAHMVPFAELMHDLDASTVPSLSYIVPDECHDSHGAPPWCVDSGPIKSVQQSKLIADMDAFAGHIVNKITSSSTWLNGNNAIIITFDEGSNATSKVATIVITNHGPRGLADGTSYSHYSLLASLQQTFGLGCLVNSCSANAMEKLFAITGATSIPALPKPYAFPTSTDTISPQSEGATAAPVSLTGTGWQVVPSISFGSNDNVLAGVSAASANDVWAVGTYHPNANGPLRSIGLDRIELIAAGAGIDRGHDRPARPVPVLRQRVPNTARVLMGTDGPHVLVGDRRDPVEDIMRRARVRARQDRPGAAAKKLDQRVLRKFAALVVADRRHRDAQ